MWPEIKLSKRLISEPPSCFLKKLMNFNLTKWQQMIKIEKLIHINLIVAWCEYHQIIKINFTSKFPAT